MRRESFEDLHVDYGAVGATAAPDMMQYPPRGFRSAEVEVRLGSGAERFTQAVDAIMSWDLYRGSGIAVQVLAHGEPGAYTGVKFAEDGTPIAPATLSAEERFTADGTPYVSSGASARLSGRVGVYRVTSRVRVVSVVEDERRVSVTFGTLGGGVASGEDAYIVELAEDDSVRFMQRSVFRAKALHYRVLPWLPRRRWVALSTRFARTLSPLWAARTRGKVTE
ncbi:uncharacterized protein (UPF0548 family) [Labedella gwakjiensis]|uniref:DUF1990 family protein n=1 Tax=Labedella gwakjiensis TaxID=390269 RepID=A0A2P8H0C5_9MICO|nr:DUF1990 family protein [Labedella gwakjiensis]PSL39649.1 uncharacterized protein (UPF0548 family) [Labedella gwakjiensis]RUQ85961.1 DUF1990 family protein [Labedella gwakjiensis]